MGFILNSRPVEHHPRFHTAFAAAFRDVPGSWRIVDCPVLTAEPLPVELPPAGGFDVVIFTSQIAAALFPIGSAQSERKIIAVDEETADTRTGYVTTALGSAWAGKKVLAVGEATANAARAAGFTYVLDTGHDVDDMRAYLARAGFGQALYPSAEDVSADLEQAFPGRVKRLVTYRMVPRAGLDLDQTVPGWRDAPVLAPLFSKRSAEILSGLLTKTLADHAGQANIAAIGISAEATVDGPWTSRAVAGEPTLAGVAEASARFARSMMEAKA
ncbi:MAG: uroporphyrinogen-III synthase [Rhodospirillaceae bacterium]|nr:uroporphyrinogen-III synthase [Rhodospirillaceae bacterium]